MKKFKKLFKNPKLFFKDFLEKRALHINGVESLGEGIAFAFHVNDWKRAFFSDVLFGREVFYVPFNLDKNASLKKKWREKLEKFPEAEFYIWGMNEPDFIKGLNNRKFYVEDGFIRSVGLGASHTLPFSLTIDGKTAYFDSTKESALEAMLSTYDFTQNPGVLDRASRVINRILETGVSKYNKSRFLDVASIYGPKKKKRILVIGQVEDDASIKYGSRKKYTNNDLVNIARLENPDAEVIYKPHPDVLAQKRPELSDPKEVAHLCHLLLDDVPLAQAFHMVDHVYTITSQAGFEALMRGIKVTTLGAPFYSGWGLTDDRQKVERRGRQLSLEELFAVAYILYPIYLNPFSKERIQIEEAVEQLLTMRQIDVQKYEATSKVGVSKKVFAFHINDWKRTLLTDFLIDREITFVPFKVEQDATLQKKWQTLLRKHPEAELYIWGLNIPGFLKDLPNPKIFMEDGFIRSVALGANHTPPFSLTMDSRTAYFDSTKESDLERMLTTYEFSENPDVLVRARRMINRIVETGISKYNHSRFIEDIDSIYGPKTKKRVLVIGQVEDDASIKYGSRKKYTNNDLVNIARLENPDAEVIYKPHPDVLAQKRPELSDPKEVAHLCRLLLDDVPLAQAFHAVDHVYTITSQAGFEALMRGIKVTTLGAPFYSGWGLTDDRQKVERRGRQLSLEELFAVAYILYPIYLNPFSKDRIQIEEAVEQLLTMRQINHQKDEESEDDAVLDRRELKNDGRIFAFNVDAWKQELLKDILIDRDISFVPSDFFEDNDLREVWLKDFQDNPEANFYIWGVKVPKILDKFDNEITFIEDGFINSIALGANCAPPFSLMMDARTVYFDSSKESELEKMLSTYDFSKNQEIIVRARKMINLIVETGISEYNQSQFIEDIDSLYGPKKKKRILVIGQLEDEISIKYGARKKYTNNDLVNIARLENPDAEIIYKPHSNVLAEKGAEFSDLNEVTHLCRLLLDDVPLAQAFHSIDHVYTITSHAGFEALMRGIKVTTLGAPFYSCWGLTDDRQNVERRSRQLKLEEIFAVAYILYPIYLNPYNKEIIQLEEAISNLLELRRHYLNSKADTNKIEEDRSVILEEEI